MSRPESDTSSLSKADNSNVLQSPLMRREAKLKSHTHHDLIKSSPEIINGATKSAALAGTVRTDANTSFACSQASKPIVRRTKTRERGLRLTEAEEHQVQCIFVTSCDDDSQMADLLKYSAMRVKQPGPITHIVYGCSADDKQKILHRNQKLFPSKQDGPQFLTHFADVNADVHVPSGATRAMPKVLGITDWVEKAEPLRNYVAILDADFVFLSKLSAKLQAETYGYAWHNSQSVPAEVDRGVVLAAHYKNFMIDSNFNKSKYRIRCEHGGTVNFVEPGVICRGDSLLESSPCDNLTQDHISDYSVGPPYMLQWDDLQTVAPTWLQFSLRLACALDQCFEVDMHAWMLALVNHGIRQVRHDRLVLMRPHFGGGYEEENWGFVDTHPLKCSTPATWDDDKLNSNVFLHYCRHYTVGDLDIYKDHVNDKKVTLTCNSSYRIPTPHAESKGMSKEERRNFFGYCTLAHSLNELMDWKCSHQ